jgi:hypothetical protein
MSRVKFTVFSDLHHHPQWYKSDAPERLSAIQKRAKESNSEFLLHLGDFSHKPSAYPELIRQYREFCVPGYFVLGNHEFDIDSFETVLETMGMESGYYFFDRSGFRFIVLDENYFRDFPGIYFHYSERNYFDHPSFRDWMPPEEIDWLRETVKNSPYPCILASHAMLDFTDGKRGVKCKEEIREIIRNSKGTPGEVILCLNGHYHRSGLDIIDGVPRLDVNSATFNWIPTPHYLFPEEWYKEYECVGNMVIYADPLSTVITIDSDSGEMIFEGVESSFVCDVSTEKSGNSSGYRLCKAENISAKINYKNLE